MFVVISILDTITERESKSLREREREVDGRWFISLELSILADGARIINLLLYTSCLIMTKVII